VQAAKPGEDARSGPAGTEPRPAVRAFHQILLWPLQLLPLKEGSQINQHWEFLDQDPAHVWKPVDDEFSTDPEGFQERHYREFVTFLPYVQRLLYGEGAERRAMGSYGESSIKAYRRSDVARARIVFPGSDMPVLFDVRHVDAYFFYDVDLVILVVEIAGADLSLETVQNALHCFGRAYPAGWTDTGDGLNCPRKVEWLDAEGHVLAASDYEDREHYLAQVCRERTPAIAAHWQYLLGPMTPHHIGVPETLRYRQLEYYRMPLMGYLALDHPERMTRGDYAKLAYAAGPGEPGALPFSGRYLEHFEARYCHDRYFDPARTGSGLHTRAICCDHAFIMTGDARQAFFMDAERGALGEFRHQFFLLALIVHMHKAALLMLSDRMVQAVTRLDITRSETVRRFRVESRSLLEIFLRFTHRYWFHDVSDHVHARDVFQAFVAQLGTERLYTEVREELQDMGHYLDSDLLRRQSMIFLRLTVVTIVGLIGTTATGFLGMNLIAAADQPFGIKLLYFVVTTILCTVLTIYTLAKSQRIAEFLDTLTNERLPLHAKASALLQIWGRKK